MFEPVHQFRQWCPNFVASVGEVEIKIRSALDQGLATGCDVYIKHLPGPERLNSLKAGAWSRHAKEGKERADPL